MSLPSSVSSKKIKVIHIITLLELGGAQQNTLFTVEHLDRSRFEVGLICGEGAFLDEEAKKIRDLRLLFLPHLIRSVNPWKDFLSLMQLIRILKSEKPDIVHTHSSKAGILGRLAAKVARVPIIIHTIHGFGFNPYQNFFSRKLFVLLERWVAKFTHCLIAVSKDNIEEGLRLEIGTREKYHLIRSGMDIKKIQAEARSANVTELKKSLGIPSGSKVVLTVGPFKVQKNLAAFVQLAKLVTKVLPQAQFLMAGDGELRGKIEHEIKISEVEKNVRILGWRRDIPQLLSLCDLFVLTSLWEGLPRAAVEALIVGKPVVAYSVNGLKEIIQDGKNGFLATPNYVQELAEKVILIVSNPSLAERLCDGALYSIDFTFDIHSMVRQQEELYEVTV